MRFSFARPGQTGAFVDEIPRKTIFKLELPACIHKIMGDNRMEPICFNVERGRVMKGLVCLGVLIE
jgi:hypothetical protein